MSMRITNIFIIFYVCISAILFKYHALPYLERYSDIRWAADSLDYIDYFNYGGLDQQLIQLGQNLFGPLVLLWLVNGDNSAIFLINVLIFLVAWFVIVKNITVDRKILFVALALNPLLLFSLLSVNKEIVSFLVVAFYSAYLCKGGKQYLVFALIAALFVRWQNIIVIILFEMLRIFSHRFGIRRKVFIFYIIFVISLIYPVFHGGLGGVTTEIVDERQAETSYGFLEVANGIQANYGYFVVLIPKVLANWFGNIPRAFGAYLTPWNYDLSDPYSTFGITGHQLAMLGIVIYLVFVRKLVLANDLVFFAFFYTIFYALGAFVQYRYYFPVYLILAIVVAQRNFNRVKVENQSSNKYTVI